MRSKLGVLIISLCATVLLTGCKVGGGGAGADSSAGGGAIVASVPYGGGSGDGGNSGSGGGDPVGGVSNPEPATLGLLSSGLLAYAALKRKKKKK